jgi:NAD+ kinase
MKIALYIAFHNKSSIDCCKEIIGLISEKNQLVIDSKIKNDLSDDDQKKFSFFDSKKPIENDFNFVFAIGGDGTILRSITYVKDSNIPILGINTGRLGFLTSIQKENIQEAISLINNNKFSIIKRTLLEVKSGSQNDAFYDYPFALNEITIQRKDTTSLLNISCEINDKYLTNYWSDGLIISTPTGSTGYSLSNGGSIVSPESNVILLNPIAPHNINMRSLVIPDNSKINIDIEGDTNINLSVDSRMYSVNCSNQIEIFKADFTIGTIKFDNDNFYKRLREKLFWGQDMRNKNLKKRNDS